MDRQTLIERPAAELEDAIGQLHALSAAVLSHLIEFVGAYDAKQAWADDEATSMTAWLAAKLGVTHDTAAGWVSVARALADLPCIGHAFAEGALAFDQVKQLVRFATPETDAALAEEASGYSAAQLRRMARRHREIAREEDDEPHLLRRFRLRWDPDRRTLVMSGRLPAAEGAVIEKTLDELVKQAPPNPETGWFEDVDTRRADALVELCSRAIADEPDADRATVSVHVDGEVLDGSAGGSAEVESGPALSVDAAMRMACDSRWQLIVHGPDGLPVAMGRTTRQVPPRLMRQLRHRDGGCRFPGCGRKGWVAAHHVKHWARGGNTDLDNLLLLCGKHHRLVHEGGWSVDWNQDREPVFVRPDGRLYQARPPPLRPEIREQIIGPEDDDAQAS